MTRGCGRTSRTRRGASSRRRPRSDGSREVTGGGPVLIAGGGIGGLALAIALARHGIASRVLERRREPAEAGAGIQLGPNAVGALSRLGVAARLMPAAGQPECLRVRDGGSGRLLTELPLGGWISGRHGAPYWVAHRADLHASLLATAASLALVEIVIGFDLASFRIEGATVQAHASDGGVREGPVLVGADGIWSTVRRQLWPNAALGYSGKTAARAVIGCDAAPAPFSDMATGVWLASGGHVVHYPVRGGTEVALVAILEEGWPGEGWGLPVDRGGLLARLRPFSSQLTGFLALAEEWRRWPLYDPAPLERWSQGRVTLLGDAAHPVLPFLAQGGALAIEDAETLAAALRAWPSEPATAIDRYERARRPRAARMQLASRRNGRIYHLPKPAALVRDLALRVLPGSRVMALYDWIYGWKRDPLD
ncbi:MAG: FAD-dependent monooxygenase [Hyphomicrobiaceae bacterium]|nr:FAD-dependent monooxygenase [Hyphomicrobiaceae bacterium]